MRANIQTQNILFSIVSFLSSRRCTKNVRCLHWVQPWLNFRLKVEPKEQSECERVKNCCLSSGMKATVGQGCDGLRTLLKASSRQATFSASGITVERTNRALWSMSREKVFAVVLLL
ncbi:hypothetical protein COOONC_00218 [Cooperia oncophora]